MPNQRTSRTKIRSQAKEPFNPNLTPVDKSGQNITRISKHPKCHRTSANRRKPSKNKYRKYFKHDGTANRDNGAAVVTAHLIFTKLFHQRTFPARGKKAKNRHRSLQNLKKSSIHRGRQPGLGPRGLKLKQDVLNSQRVTTKSSVR
jgi:hypothetical protein